MSKRAVWIAEGFLGIIAIVGVFTGYEEIAMACVVGIAATMDKLVER